MIGFGIVIVGIAPGPDHGRRILSICRNICVEKPEGDINSLYFINVILVLKDLGQEPFPQLVVIEGSLGSLFIQLEGNNRMWF